MSEDKYCVRLKKLRDTLRKMHIDNYEKLGMPELRGSVALEERILTRIELAVFGSNAISMSVWKKYDRKVTYAIQDAILKRARSEKVKG